MTRFFLTRHGETVWHAENRYTGVSDIDLTDNGRTQSKALARWAASARLDAIYASTLKRSIETAQPAISATGLGLHVDRRLREVDFGKGEGLTRSEMREAFGDSLAAFLQSPGTCPLPEGEAGEAAVLRCVEAMNEISQAFPQGRVLIVMHSTLLRLVLTHLMGVDLNRYRTLFPQMQNTSLNEIEYTPEEPERTAVLMINAPAVLSALME